MFQKVGIVTFTGSQTVGPYPLVGYSLIVSRLYNWQSYGWSGKCMWSQICGLQSYKGNWNQVFPFKRNGPAGMTVALLNRVGLQFNSLQAGVSSICREHTHRNYSQSNSWHVFWGFSFTYEAATHIYCGYGILPDLYRGTDSIKCCFDLCMYTWLSSSLGYVATITDIRKTVYMPSLWRCQFTQTTSPACAYLGSEPSTALTSKANVGGCLANEPVPKEFRQLQYCHLCVQGMDFSKMSFPRHTWQSHASLTYGLLASPDLFLIRKYSRCQDQWTGNYATIFVNI